MAIEFEDEFDLLEEALHADRFPDENLFVDDDLLSYLKPELITPEAYERLKDPTSEEIGVFLDFLEEVLWRKNSYLSFGGRHHLDTFLHHLLDISEPLVVDGSIGGSLIVDSGFRNKYYEPDSEFYQHWLNEALDQWQDTVMIHGLLALTPDRSRRGLAGMDRVQAKIIKLSSRQLQQSLGQDLPVTNGQLFEVLRQPRQFRQLVQRWFVEQASSDGITLFHTNIHRQTKERWRRLGAFLAIPMVDEFEEPTMPGRQPEGDWRNHPDAEEFWPEDYGNPEADYY